MKVLPRHSGIALIQVLFLSVIISVMLLSIVHQSKRHTKLAQYMLDRTQASLQLNSIEAETAFLLLTQLRRANSASPFLLSRTWNFHGQTVQMGSVEVQLQDISGLGSIYNPRLVSFLLAQQGVAEPTLSLALQYIADATKTTRELPDSLQPFINLPDVTSRARVPMQLIDEIGFFAGLAPAQVAGLRRLLTSYPIPQYNYLTMPPEILSFYLESDILAAVLNSRERGELNGEKFSSITGLSFDESFGINVGRAIRVRFTVSKNDVKLRRQVDFVVDPYAAEPLTHWEYHKYRHAD